MVINYNMIIGMTFIYFIIAFYAETTTIEICSSADLILGEAFAEKYNKENCENHNGEWIDGECDFYENQLKEGWEVDEDNFYKEVDEDEESDKGKKHRLSIEDGESNNFFIILNQFTCTFANSEQNIINSRFF
jgi:hypothetical protein